MENYVVVRSETMGLFVYQVNKLIHQGYEPAGGMTTIHNVFYQAMYKPPQEPK